jgi:hypothetical protein
LQAFEETNLPCDTRGSTSAQHQGKPHRSSAPNRIDRPLSVSIDILSVSTMTFRSLG